MCVHTCVSEMFETLLFYCPPLPSIKMAVPIAMQYGVREWGICQASLEEVFIKIAERSEEANAVSASPMGPPAHQSAINPIV